MFQQWNVEFSSHIYKHARGQKTTDKTQSKSVRSINTASGKKKKQFSRRIYADTNGGKVVLQWI